MQQIAKPKFGCYSTECHEACKDGCDGPGTDKCVDCYSRMEAY